MGSREQRLRERIRKARLAALVVAVIGSGCVGPTKTPLAEERSYKDCKIAFCSNRDGNLEIHTMNADGSEQKNLTDNPAYDWFPSWSPFLPSETERER